MSSNNAATIATPNAPANEQGKREPYRWRQWRRCISQTCMCRGGSPRRVPRSPCKIGTQHRVHRGQEPNTTTSVPQTGAHERACVRVPPSLSLSINNFSLPPSLPLYFSSAPLSLSSISLSCNPSKHVSFSCVSVSVSLTGCLLSPSYSVSLSLSFPHARWPWPRKRTRNDTS